MHPVFFPNATAFRTWLEHHHQTETELWVGYYKVATGKPSMTWSESVDQALCFGWIDGLRKSVDAESYCIRFTPRKPDSIWSAVNLKKVESLTRKGSCARQDWIFFQAKTGKIGTLQFRKRTSTPFGGV